MNVKTGLEDVVAALKLIEGESYDIGEVGDRYSLMGAIGRLGELKTPPVVVYGRDGWNRYFIERDGEISISPEHSSARALQIADALGMRFWG